MKRFKNLGITNKDLHLDIEVLTASQKLKLIDLFYYSYFNTNQDVEDFAPEFYNTLGKIMSNSIPLKLKSLDIDEDMYDNIKKILED